MLARLPTLRILDGVDVTLEEYTDSQADNATEWLFSGKLDKDEDEIWKWTPGYEPPEELLRDSKKLDLMRRIQQVLTHSLTYSLTHSLTYLLTHSLTHLLTHSLTHSLTHLLRRNWRIVSGC